MSYSVKEIYFTLQGEGANAGRAAVFCRFAGCNLWSGVEGDRSTAACRFCDTDFVGTDGPGGGRFQSPEELARKVRGVWTDHADGSGEPLVVCTGGEPLLQLNAALIEELHLAGLEVAVETNGTLDLPPGVDWTCVSPKAHTELVVRSGSELKLVYPQDDAMPERYSDLDFEHFYLQPMDGPRLSKNIELAVDYCRAHPQWRLSLQVHKLVGIP